MFILEFLDLYAKVYNFIDKYLKESLGLNLVNLSREIRMLFHIVRKLLTVGIGALKKIQVVQLNGIKIGRLHLFL